MRIDKDAHPVNTTHEAARPATLLDMLKLMAARPLLLAAGSLAGALIGLLVAVLTPPTYEAVAVVRMGVVPVNLTVIAREALQQRAIETPAQAAERLRLRSFFAQSKLQGDPAVLAKRVNARILRDTDLLEIRYRAPGRDEAEHGLRAIFDTLRSRQEELAVPVKAGLAEQLRVVQQMRSESTGRRSDLLQALRGSPLSSIRGEYPFLQLAFVGEDNELLRWEMALKTAMSPPVTTSPELVEAVSVADKPVNPARVLAVVAGLFAGFLCAAGFISFSWTRSRRAARD